MQLLRLKTGENPHVIEDMMEDNDLRREGMREYEKFIYDKTRYHDKELIIEGYEGILDH